MLINVTDKLGVVQRIDDRIADRDYPSGLGTPTANYAIDSPKNIYTRE
jgi:hypothetical protein